MTSRKDLPERLNGISYKALCCIVKKIKNYEKKFKESTHYGKYSSELPISEEAINDSMSDSSYKCSFFPYRTKFSSTLKRHILRHTGERPYRCAICGKTFIQKGNMQRHMMSHE